MVVANYVKFLRGTPNAWNSLQEKDNNTLYFICEPNAEVGELYLGSKLICSSSKVILKLDNLEDVTIDEETLKDNSFLVYNQDISMWENRTLEEISKMLDMHQSIYNFEVNGEKREKCLLLFLDENIDSPMNGDIAVINNDGDIIPFIYDGEKSKWIMMSNKLAVNKKIFFFNEVGELDLNGFANAPVGSMPFKSTEGKLDWIISESLDLEKINKILFGKPEENISGLVTDVGDISKVQGNQDSVADYLDNIYEILSWQQA